MRYLGGIPKNEAELEEARVLYFEAWDRGAEWARPGYFSLSLLVRVKFTLDLTTGEQSNETQHGG